jgi:hypothetical protein
MMILWSGIRAWAATGLFTGQLGDVRDHYPVPYELYQNGVLFQSGFLNQGDPWGSPGLIGISLPAPGAYRLQIPYTNYFIAGQQGSAFMEASFDSGKSDRDPPYLTQFNVFDNGEPTDTVLSGTGQVVSRVLDDVGLKQVTLYYDAGSGWQALGLTRNGDQYVADMPTLGANTFVSLKLVAEDTSGNRLSHEMRPALFVQGVSENVSTPSTLGGPTSGTIGTSYFYSTGGSSSNLGHSVQYFFDWGDGTNSGWLPVGTISAAKSWASAGTYNGKAQARCASHTTVVSDWSPALSVTISVPETVSKPSTPSGPTNGISGASYTYSTGGSSSNLGHSVQYLFDWGDGTDSGWLPVGTISAAKSWVSAGTYNVKAQGRCATHTSVVSDWSQTFSVNIVYSWQSESVNWQVYYGNNWNRSGTVTKPGATRIRLHFSTIDLERGYDHLRTDVGNDWSGSYSNVFSNEKSGNSIGLTLTSDFSVNGSFVIDRVEWLGAATGPATRSGDLFGGAPTPQPPSAPTNVSASDGTYTDRVRLTWTASSGATGYKVFRHTSNNSSGAQQIGTSTASQYDDTTAVVGTTYWYWVKAYNSAGDSGFSNGDSGFVSAPTPQPPSAPTSVSASDGTYTDRVRLSWTASSGATGYKVFRNTSNNSSGAQQIGTSTASQYDDTTAVVGTTYWYWVKAYNSAGDSGFSNGDSGYVASSSSWQSESVNWTVVYGNNWNKSGTVTKPGATRIRLHFSVISLEAMADHLRTDAGDDWSGDYSNVTSQEKAGNSIGLTLTSDYSRTGYFIIDRVEWQGTSTGPPTKSGSLFQ